MDDSLDFCCILFSLRAKGDCKFWLGGVLYRCFFESDKDAIRGKVVSLALVLFSIIVDFDFKMEEEIKAGHCWKSKTNPDYTVYVAHVFFGRVFFQRWGATAHLKKKDFLEHFEYSHYAPTHQEMG